MRASTRRGMERAETDLVKVAASTSDAQEDNAGSRYEDKTKNRNEIIRARRLIPGRL